MSVLIGVLALQGDFVEHVQVLDAVGGRARQVRDANQLDGLDGLVIPGGESTTIGMLMERYDLVDPIRGKLVQN